MPFPLAGMLNWNTRADQKVMAFPYFSNFGQWKVKWNEVKILQRAIVIRFVTFTVYLVLLTVYLRKAYNEKLNSKPTLRKRSNLSATFNAVKVQLFCLWYGWVLLNRGLSWWLNKGIAALIMIRHNIVLQALPHATQGSGNASATRKRKYRILQHLWSSFLVLPFRPHNI